MPKSVPTGSRIRDRRLALGRKQAHVAAAAGISASYLNLIEHNRRAIGGALLGQLAEVLEVDRAALSEDGDAELVEATRAAGAANGLDAEAQGSVGDLVQRSPAWARVIAAQADALAGQARTIEALSDRLTHDPALADAMHELLSTVSVVRSTASILAQTPEIDANWLGRFHANLDAESRRLAEGAQAVMAHFERQGARDAARLLPAEAAQRFLDAHGHRFDALEEEGVAAIPGLVEEIAEDGARGVAAEMLVREAEDAARLPLAVVAGVEVPDALAEAAGGDLALVLRRMAVADPGKGLVIADAAGAVLRRKPVAGFPMPTLGAGCPLWPLYAALGQPGVPLATRIRMPDGAAWRAHAIAAPEGGARFGGVAVMRATMLLGRADGPGEAVLVGPGCRTCPRAGCPARREPSILAAAGAVEAAEQDAPALDMDPIPGEKRPIRDRRGGRA